MLGKPYQMSERLRELIEKARHYKMTPEEKFEQRVSFVYGQQDHDSPGKTKDEIREMLIDIYGRPPMTNQPDDLVERLGDEADLCRNDGANDIADLLDEAKSALVEADRKNDAMRAEWNEAEARAAKAEEALRVIATNKTKLGITWAQEYAREALGEEKA